MSKRSERREAERITRKLAYQTRLQHQTNPPAALEPEATPELELAAQPEATPISEAQLAANRANARLSTGPVSEAGRARSSRNALKHGLTGKTVLLPHEDAAQYQRELHQWLDTYQPATDEELRLVQSQNDCVWRISRIQRLETAILLKGNLECAAKYEDRPASERTQLIEADAYLKYEKQLRNLFLQEARLRRVMEKDRAELLRLQGLRKREDAQRPPQPLQNGFEFSNAVQSMPTAPDRHFAAAGWTAKPAEYAR